MTIDETRTLVAGDVIEIEDAHRQLTIQRLRRLVWLEASQEAAVQRVRQMDGQNITISDIQLMQYRKTGERDENWFKAQ